MPATSFVMFLMMRSVALQCNITIWSYDSVKFMNMDFDSHAEQMSSCESSVVSSYWICCWCWCLWWCCCYIFPYVHLFCFQNNIMSCGSKLSFSLFAWAQHSSLLLIYKKWTWVCLSFSLTFIEMKWRENVSFNWNRFLSLLCCYNIIIKNSFDYFQLAIQIYLNILSIVFPLEMSLKFGKHNEALLLWTIFPTPLLYEEH